MPLREGTFGDVDTLVLDYTMSRRANPQPYSLGLQFSLEQPLDYEDAREAARTFAEQRQAARQMLESAYAEQAQAEAEYRRAKARCRPKAEGDTAKARDEWVDSETATERQARDEAEFKVKLIRERLEEIDGTRASFHQLLSWSAKVDPNAEDNREPRPELRRAA